MSFVLTFTDDKTGEENSSDFNGYVSCQEINDGDANLVITHLALADSWDDESAAREDVLSTLTFEGQTPDTGTPTEEKTPEATEPNNNDGSGQLTEIQGDGELPDNADELLSLFQTSVSDINDYWAREYPLISAGRPMHRRRRLFRGPAISTPAAARPIPSTRTPAPAWVRSTARQTTRLPRHGLRQLPVRFGRRGAVPDPGRARP